MALLYGSKLLTFSFWYNLYFRIRVAAAAAASSVARAPPARKATGQKASVSLKQSLLILPHVEMKCYCMLEFFVKSLSH